MFRYIYKISNMLNKKSYIFVQIRYLICAIRYLIKDIRYRISI